MRERPILFSGPMVRAILDGRKTQTRRVLRVPDDADEVRYWTTPSGRVQSGWADPGVNYWTPRGNHLSPCPYGVPGDRLWVRESARLRSVGPKRGELSIVFNADAGMGGSGDVFDHILVDGQAQPYKATRWTPGIHMPRWASRLTLEVTGVRVEQLQDISEADCVAEGQPADSANSPRVWYMATWGAINGHGSWSANPWVWVVEFRRVV